MAKAKKEVKPVLVSAFYLKVDGKEYGPFATTHEREVKKLYHYKGIDPRYVNIPKDQLIVPPKKARKKVQEPSLLDGVEWTPTHKIQKFW